MTWTYSGDPADSARDGVRFLVGDIDTTHQQISDEEIDYVLTLHPAVAGSPNYMAAAVVAEAIAARYATKADKTVGGLSIRYSERRNSYLAMAASLRSSNRLTGIGPPQLGGGGPTYLGNEYV